MNFNKTPLNLQKQINHITTKFRCDDKKLLEQYLLNCNYYRLRGYWLFFDNIEAEISFKEVINLYEFDKNLRILFLSYIERIEISIKSIFAYHLTTKYNNPHIHLDKNIFINNTFYQQSIKQLKDSFDKSKELFAKHFQKYDENLPPLWASVELMTLGEISKWYSNLNIKDRKEIANYYKISQKSLYTFLMNLTEVRNLSAHYSRLWNRRILKTFSMPKKFDIVVNNQIFKIYHTAIMINYILDEISENNQFFEEFVALIKNYNIPLKYMGFDKNHKIDKLYDIEYEYKRKI